MSPRSEKKKKVFARSEQNDIPETVKTIKASHRKEIYDYRITNSLAPYI